VDLKTIYFPNIDKAANMLRGQMASEEKLCLNDVRVLVSPYRICPLGAHIDHQGGPVLGMTINACTLMAYVPSDASDVRLRSLNYPGRVVFDLAAIGEVPGSFWGVYARAAALALQEKHPLTRGITGLIDGMLPGCGLSSSASVLLAYLHALADANDLALAPWDYVHLTRRAENGHIGLNNGILDQTSIVFGRQNHLLHIDTRAEEVTHLPENGTRGDYAIIVAYSGISRELTTSGYNTRVQECVHAAELLAQHAGLPTAKRLSDLSPEVFARYGDRLPAPLDRRARHFASEVQRVNEGISAWRDGRLADFGRLMRASGRSSVEQYECGSPAIHDLQQIMKTTEGVLGARFSGGGFGGCVVGLAEPDRAGQVAAVIREAYTSLHPEVRDQAAVYLAESADGVRLL
jgi:galactokinase/galacturonokinase